MLKRTPYVLLVVPDSSPAKNVGHEIIDIWKLQPDLQRGPLDVVQDPNDLVKVEELLGAVLDEVDDRIVHGDELDFIVHKEEPLEELADVIQSSRESLVRENPLMPTVYSLAGPEVWKCHVI